MTDQGAAIRPVAGAKPHFPERYWDKKFKDELRRIHVVPIAEPAAIGLAPPPGWDETVKEAEDVVAKQASPDYALRRADTIAEHEDRPWVFTRLLLIGQETHPVTISLFNAAIADTRGTIMHYKNIWKRPRPSQVDPRIRPLFDVPGHPAYPSGHSTQAHLIAHVLAEIAGDRDDIRGQMLSIAWRIAENREYAGVHYRSDSQAGAILGKVLFGLFRDAYAEEIGKAREECAGQF